MNTSYTEKEKAKRKIFEAMLEYAGSCHVENINDELDELYQSGEQINFPPELDIKMRKLIADYNRKKSFKKAFKGTGNVFLKMAVALSVIFLCTAACVVSVDALRVKVLNFVMEETEKYTSIDMKEETESAEYNPDAIPLDWEGLYTPTYIPEGFWIKKSKSLRGISTIYYSNSNNQTIIFQQRNGEKVNLRIDTENAITSEIRINEYEGVLIEKDKQIKIVWYNDNDSFVLMGEIDIDELIKVAKSVKIAE